MKQLTVYFITFCLLTSCFRNGEKCEGFDFSRIPFDYSYYENQLKYTNGIDTIALYPSSSYSEESRLNPMSNPLCNPRFEINYSTKTGNDLHFLFSFSYYPESDTTEFSLSVNASSNLLSIESQMKKRIERDEEWIFNGFSQPERYDSTFLIKKLTLKGMRIIEVEKLTGEKWKLIKVGNKVC